MSSQKLYLKKIENDVNEKLYDLLVLHLKNVHEVLPKTSSNKEILDRLYSLLNLALNNLKKEQNKFNYLYNLRQSIEIINTLLSYDAQNNSLKKRKLEILNSYSSNDIYDTDEKIPLKSQMTELRITYNTNYLEFLLEKKFIPKKMWDKAMYCLIAIELVEPDHKNLSAYKKELEKHLHRDDLKYENKDEPKDCIILLDTNIVLSKVLHDVDNYKIEHFKMEEYNKKMEMLGNSNKFVITNSVKNELEKNLSYTLSIAKNICKDNRKYNYENIKKTLEKRFKKIIDKYSIGVKKEEYDLKHIEKFYSNYLGNLYDITLDKIENRKLSKKLKKLSDREGLLPETGDLKLLADAILLKKNNEKVAILSNDKDLYLFAKNIYEEFGIEVYK